MTTEHLSCAPGSGIDEELPRSIGANGPADIVALDGAAAVMHANRAGVSPAPPYAQPPPVESGDDAPAVIRTAPAPDYSLKDRT